MKEKGPRSGNWGDFAIDIRKILAGGGDNVIEQLKAIDLTGASDETRELVERKIKFLEGQAQFDASIAEQRAIIKRGKEELEAVNRAIEGRRRVNRSHRDVEDGFVEAEQVVDLRAEKVKTKERCREYVEQLYSDFNPKLAEERGFGELLESSLEKNIQLLAYFPEEFVSLLTYFDMITVSKDVVLSEADYAKYVKNYMDEVGVEGFDISGIKKSEVTVFVNTVIVRFRETLQADRQVLPSTAFKDAFLARKSDYKYKV